MEILVLGAGPAYTNRAGAIGAAYLLRHHGTDLLLDLGQGAFPRLAAALEPSGLAAVLVSHLHPDHFVDLVALRHYLRYEFRPGRRVRVHAPGGLAARLDALFGEDGFAAAALDIRPLAEAFTVGAFTVTTRRVTHTADSHAFRITTADGPGLVYSGDCGVADDLAPLLRPGDVLLAEVSFGPGPVPVGALHLDGPSIGRLAAARGAGRVLLTHLQMGYDPAETLRSVQQQYEGEVRLVAPGDRFTIHAP